MSLTAVRSISMLSKALSCNRVLLTNSLFRFGQLKNTRTLTRSLFFLCRKNDSDLGHLKHHIPWSNKCSCGCSLHTKGDQELAAFLTEEIENEIKAQASPDLPKLGDFTCQLSGADVTLTKKMDTETIIIKANVNNSVDAEDEDVVDTNEAKEPEPSEMKSKPEFTVEIQKGKKILSFLCTYSHAMPDEDPNEAYNDSFQISEVSLYEGEYDDSKYTVSGDIMDGYLYDLLMNYLEERGISNDFADEMGKFFTAYEHKLYISLLQGMKSFVEKK
ncbi:complement component 1 Q subcomponent-binding protein, mitochondrial-like [Uloborus diversus]|uniref:complement component 1 Q subcomponent-binding protein, mitochondrial-like n=1 Tax=Uloborus diversus TaxID=327109 RepID=UPI0024094B68|nr:complement component 1 Q subcomponent-binding protein, mitochondrial-like [Uloborus diversus]